MSAWALLLLTSPIEIGAWDVPAECSSRAAFMQKVFRVHFTAPGPSRSEPGWGWKFIGNSVHKTTRERASLGAASALLARLRVVCDEKIAPQEPRARGIDTR